ncbi:MAG TPA: serine O-acetyltransferase [Gammaproteobacteria bacterium]|nr:serine O-acetyltransferase [Gammaproteobacteria bacterium]
MFAQLKEDIDCVFDRDPAARNWFEVLTSYPGVHALQAHRIAHRVWNYDLKWLARVFSSLARFLTGIEIHPAAKIGRRFFIDHGMGVVIGETAEIGDDCTIYHGVTLGGTSWETGKRHPTLRDGVVVGAGAKVLGPIVIGERSRIGSNAVVVKDVPASASVVGVPGRMVTEKHKVQEKRQKLASKMGFDAYGATQDMPDPVADAVNRMLDHIHVLDERQEKMCEILKKMGAAMDDVKLPNLDACKLDDGELAEEAEEKFHTS